MFVIKRKVKLFLMLKLLYLMSLVFVFFYVKSVLTTTSFEASAATPKEKAVDVREISAKLNVEIDGTTTRYEIRTKNTDTVEDFLSDLRDDAGFYYEVDLYTYGAEIVSVFGKEAQDGEKWALLLNGVDITNKISREFVTEDDNYLLKQVNL